MICTPHSWTQRCAARAMAQRAGEVTYRYKQGWVMQFMGTYDAINLVECPYCGGTLPQLKAVDPDVAWRRLWRALFGDGGEGGE